MGLYSSLSCPSKKDDVYAWEANAGGFNPGPSCDGCVAYYGCLNRDCCDELATALDQTKLLQLLSLIITVAVVACSAVSAVYLSKRVARDANESILSHLGARATLVFMVAAIIAGALVIAIGAANVESSTASNSKGLGDLSTDYDSADNSTGAVTDLTIDQDSGESSDNANARVRYNKTCLTAAYGAYQRSVAPNDKNLAFLAPPLLLRPCVDQCAAWATDPVPLGCSSDAARRANPTMTCVMPNATCFAADLDDGSCDTSTGGAAVAGATACSDPGFDDRAVTNGECKAYTNVLQLVLPNDLGGVVPDTCRLQVTFEVDHGGKIQGICDQGSGSGLQCQESSASPAANGVPRSTFMVSGSALAVAAAVANFSFCPSCIDTTYHVAVRIATLNATACVANNGYSHNITILAATNLEQTFTGSVVNGACLVNSVGGVGCWDGSQTIGNAVITAHTPCYNRTAYTSNAGGQFSLGLPYRASEHGTEVLLSFAADDFEGAARKETLGATSLGHDSTRYAWVGGNTSTVSSAGFSRSDSGYCVDLTTSRWASPRLCADAGVDTCSIFSSVLIPNLKLSLPCACNSVAPSSKDGGPFCSLSTYSYICPGCRPGTAGPCMTSDGACYQPNENAQCGADNNEWCVDGWPCACEYGLTENIHTLGPQLLFPVPTAAPTAHPTRPPTPKPTEGPSTAPTGSPTVPPSASPSPAPSTGLTIVPSPLPSMTPTQPFVTIGGVIVDALTKAIGISATVTCLNYVSVAERRKGVNLARLNECVFILFVVAELTL